ncbi:MAG: tetratricopeptide repeat protein, partial [Candidatus Zixiibacteriota bacterium]
LAVILLAAVVKRVYETSATKGIPTAQTGEHSLAILTFDNKTGDSTYDWLETGLPEILLTDLAQTEAIDLISRERILDYLHRERGTGPDSYTHTDLADAARALGAVNLLSGSLYKFGDHLRLDARLEQVASGKIILGEKVLGRNVFALVDSLTEKIADRLNISGPKSSTVSVSELTSTSTEAYQLYHQGMELFGLELFEEAIEKFNRALTIDPNFALAYMRIGMANVFQGRPQQGAQYFALAQEYQDRLPVRERSLLEIYSGFWLEQKYDDAWARLESYVNHYPDDKEARSIYGLAIYAFERDTARAFSHFDTALHIDPQYQLALSLYSQIALQAGNIDKAVEYAELVRQYHPESPAAYLELADLYAQQMKINEAINECEIVLSRFPDNSQAIFELCELFIRKRNFEQSRKYVEQIAEKHGQDPYHMGSYYRCLANLADWSGKFRTSLDYRFQVLKQAQLTGDSTIISNEFETIADYYNRFGFLDSALHYSREAYRWANPFQRLDHAIQLVAFDAGTADEARPIFKKALDDFKSRIPSEVWPLAQAVEKLFEAYCAFDTNAIIAAYEKIAQEQDQEASGGVREAAYLRVMSGQYETGKDILQRFVSGRHETTSGYYYPYTQYLLGIANEGLGNTREAIRNYEEMLKYWGSPEIELKEIKDARARLAKLTS